MASHLFLHMPCSNQFLINGLSAADSVVTLLGELDVSAFPWDERIAVGACRAKAHDAGLKPFKARGGRDFGRAALIERVCRRWLKPARSGPFSLSGGTLRRTARLAWADPELRPP